MPRGIPNIAFRILVATILLVAVIALLRILLDDEILVVEASSISQVLKFAGIQHVRLGNIIYVSAPHGLIGFSIEWHCSGFVTLMLYLLLLALIPISYSRRLTFIALGFPTIYMLNAIRVALVIAVAKAFNADVAAAIHTFVGPLILAGFVVLLAFTALREEITEGRLPHASQTRR